MNEDTAELVAEYKRRAERAEAELNENREASKEAVVRAHQALRSYEAENNRLRARVAHLEAEVRYLTGETDE